MTINYEHLLKPDVFVANSARRKAMLRREFNVVEQPIELLGDAKHQQLIGSLPAVDWFSVNSWLARRQLLVDSLSAVDWLAVWCAT